MSPSEPSPDGGAESGEESAEDIFTVDQENVAKITAGQRITRTLDGYVFTPLRIAWGDWRTRMGLPIVLFFVAMGTIGPSLVDTPQYGDYDRLIPPFTSWEVPLGTDGTGQALGPQIVHGTPVVLKFVIAGVVFAAGVGVLIGLFAGYKGGRVDDVLMTFTDVVLSLPGLPLIVFLAAVIPPKNAWLVGVLIAIDNWPGLARSVRSQVLAIREQSFIEAARAQGMASSRIITHEITPRIAPYVMINGMQAARQIVLTSVGLYFLGILPQTNSYNWGYMMQVAHNRGAAVSNPGQAGHWLLWPALALGLFVFGLVILSQGLDRVFNPRLRARHSKTIVDEDGETDASYSAGD